MKKIYMVWFFFDNLLIFIVCQLFLPNLYNANVTNDNNIFSIKVLEIQVIRNLFQSSYFFDKMRKERERQLNIFVEFYIWHIFMFSRFNCLIPELVCWMLIKEIRVVFRFDYFLAFLFLQTTLADCLLIDWKGFFFLQNQLNWG